MNFFETVVCSFDIIRLLSSIYIISVTLRLTFGPNYVTRNTLNGYIFLDFYIDESIKRYGNRIFVSTVTLNTSYHLLDTQKYIRLCMTLDILIGSDKLSLLTKLRKCLKRWILNCNFDFLYFLWFGSSFIFRGPTSKLISLDCLFLLCHLKYVGWP